MAFALVRATADGNNTPITLGFAYRNASDLVVKVDGVTKNPLHLPYHQHCDIHHW